MVELVLKDYYLEKWHKRSCKYDIHWKVLLMLYTCLRGYYGSCVALWNKGSHCKTRLQNEHGKITGLLEPASNKHRREPQTRCLFSVACS